MQNANNSRQTAKLLFFIFGLPLLVLLVASWQMWRTPSATENATERASIAATIATIEQDMGANTPRVMIKTTDGKSYPAHVIVTNLKRRLNRLERTDAMEYAPIVYGSGIASALLAACVGGFGLVAIRRMGKRAMASREALLHSFEKGKNLLPWILAGTAGFFILGIACCIAYELLNIFAADNFSNTNAKLLLVGACVTVGLFLLAGKIVLDIFKSSRASFSPAPRSIMGRTVSEIEAPKLWAFVRGIAESAKAVIPHNIVVGLNECFFVTEWPVELTSGSEVPPGRTLYLPVPYMAFMKEDEVAAVIGHELAHFTGADTEYSLKFAPIYAGAVRNMEILASTSPQKGDFNGLFKPAAALGDFFLGAFHTAVQHWSRERELAADKVGAFVANNRAFGLSLLRISVLTPPIYEVLGEFWNKGGKLAVGILQRLLEVVKEKGLSDPRKHLKNSQPHPTDSHPTDIQRLEAIGVTVDDALLADAASPECSTFLQDMGLAEGRTASTTDAKSPATSQAIAVSQDSTTSQAAAALQSPIASTRCGISESLEADFIYAAKTTTEEIIDLRKFAAYETPDRPLFAGLYLFLILKLLLGGAAVAFATLILMKKKTYPHDLWISAGLIAFAVLFLALCLRAFLNRNTPFITLTADGFLFNDLQAPIPWTAVEDYSIIPYSFSGILMRVDTVITLDKGYSPPPCAKTRWAKYIAKGHRVTFVIPHFPFRMNAGTFNSLLGSYWAAASARARLAELGED